jgi:hypothetical protein
MRSFADLRPPRTYTKHGKFIQELDGSVIYETAGGVLLRVSLEDECVLAGYGWYVANVGYAQAAIEKYDNRLLHRLIYERMHGEYDTSTHRVDHINGDILDNRRVNLRLSTVSENGLHRTKLNQNNKSGKTGVHFDKKSKKWCAELFVNGVKYRLGKFESLTEAISARVAAEEVYATGFESKT